MSVVIDEDDKAGEVGMEKQDSRQRWCLIQEAHTRCEWHMHIQADMKQPWC